MLKNNIEEFNILNILNWHNEGYKGEGIKVAELEACNVNLPFFDGKVKDPFGRCNNYKNTHGQHVVDIIHQIAPKSEIFAMPITVNNNGKGTLFDEVLPYARANNINIIAVSLGGLDSDIVNKKIRDYKKYGLTFITSAGNNSKDGLSGYARSNEWISVGAVHLKTNGDIYLANYSSIGEELDIVSFSNLVVNNAKHPNQESFYKEGTSFSSPVIAGMLALVQEFFFKNTGKFLNQKQIELFINDNVVDLGIKGRDDKFGKGIFILPNPKEIDIDKYLKGEDFMLNDIEGHWAESYIKKVVDLGILEGYPDGSFKPENTITRAQISKIIVKLLKLK